VVRTSLIPQKVELSSGGWLEVERGESGYGMANR